MVVQCFVVLVFGGFYVLFSVHFGVFLIVIQKYQHRLSLSSADLVRLLSGTQALKATVVHQVQPLSWTSHTRSLLISSRLPSVSLQLEGEAAGDCFTDNC